MEFSIYLYALPRINPYASNAAMGPNGRYAHVRHSLEVNRVQNRLAASNPTSIAQKQYREVIRV